VTDVSTLRADAQRNLERIVEAARAVFAEQGLDASVADVARRAGVGTATIFRRFPTKEDLIAAIIEDEVRTIAERARAAGSLREFAAEALEFAVGDRAFCEAGGTDLFERPQLHERVEEVYAAVDDLLARAQEAGEVREDVVAADVAFLIRALSQAAVGLEPSAPGVWRRYLDLVLDGLRPEGARPLSRKPPTTAQLTELKKRK
jgi:AcrR family transcriptional regulator